MLWTGGLEPPNDKLNDGPLESLEGARYRRAEFERWGPLTEAVRVIIADGTYPVRKTLVFFPPQTAVLLILPIVYAALLCSLMHYFRRPEDRLSPESG